MGFVAAAVIGSTLVGGYAANKAAKSASAAQDRATEASLEAFRFSQPYIKDSYDKAGGYLHDVQGAGAYQGQTLASMKTPIRRPLCRPSIQPMPTLASTMSSII